MRPDGRTDRRTDITQIGVGAERTRGPQLRERESQPKRDPFFGHGVASRRILLVVVVVVVEASSATAKFTVIPRNESSRFWPFLTAANTPKKFPPPTWQKIALFPPRIPPFLTAANTPKKCENL